MSRSMVNVITPCSRAPGPPDGVTPSGASGASVLAYGPRAGNAGVVLDPVSCGRYDAVFALDDPDALVGAGLSCPACLDEATRLLVAVVDGGLDARCACAACGSTWSLTLRPQQLLRLSLDPPSTADVRWSRSLPPLELDDD
jgi:hypothetical protein